METKDFVSTFFMKAVLGRKVSEGCTESILKGCIKKAYGDMMTVGRFYSETQGKEENCRRILEEFEKHKFCFSMALIEDVQKILSPKERIDKIEGNGDYATTFGLAQKVVNMAYKYFYCFRDFMPEIRIDFTKCDCPVDSIILDAVRRKGALSEKRFVWSKLTKKDYMEIQNWIENEAGSVPVKDCSKKLFNDFKNW